jgi:hypothetical protein
MSTAGNRYREAIQGMPDQIVFHKHKKTALLQRVLA